MHCARQGAFLRPRCAPRQSDVAELTTRLRHANARRCTGGKMSTDRRLEIKGISKRYGETVAVRDLGFDVHAGELFGFVGRDGAGKTTTMRIVLGVLAPDAGEVRWDGRPLNLAARRRIGYMPEERGLYRRCGCPSSGLPRRASRHGRLGSPGPAVRWLDRFGLRTGPTTISRRSAWATSDLSSWPPLWSSVRTSSCSTSRSPGSTR